MGCITTTKLFKYRIYKLGSISAGLAFNRKKCSFNRSLLFKGMTRPARNNAFPCIHVINKGSRFGAVRLVLQRTYCISVLWVCRAQVLFNARLAARLVKGKVALVQRELPVSLIEPTISQKVPGSVPASSSANSGGL